MARILIGWELGANQGHITRMLQLVEALSDEGHDLALGLQNLGDLPAGRLSSFTVYQAPIWPRLLANMARRSTKATGTMGDILHALGLDRAETLPALITGWRNIFAAFKPDLVIADFAPALLCAARGRVASIQVGTGFCVPPAHVATFPLLHGNVPTNEEAATLKRVNRGLKVIGDPPLERLPQIFDATVHMVASFAEIDPYAAHRTAGYTVPSTAMPVPQIAAGGGDEVFVYGFEQAMAVQPLWDGLMASGLKIRTYIPHLSAEVAQELTARGMIVEPEKLPFADISRRSRLVLSHGGHGFVCSALLAGLPQVITHYDLEKASHGRGIANQGLGGHVELRSIKVEPFAESLRQFYFSDAAQDAARAAAARFHAKIAGRSAAGEIVAAVNGVL